MAQTTSAANIAQTAAQTKSQAAKDALQVIQATTIPTAGDVTSAATDGTGVASALKRLGLSGGASTAANITGVGIALQDINAEADGKIAIAPADIKNEEKAVQNLERSQNQ